MNMLKYSGAAKTTSVRIPGSLLDRFASVKKQARRGCYDVSLSTLLIQGLADALDAVENELAIREGGAPAAFKPAVAVVPSEKTPAPRTPVAVPEKKAVSVVPVAVEKAAVDGEKGVKDFERDLEENGGVLGDWA